MRTATRALFLLLLLSSFFITIPVPADAASIVNCGRTPNPANANGDPDPSTSINEAAPCTLCHFVLGIQGIMSWGMRVMIYIALAVIVAMGLLYIISAGNDEMMS